MGENIIFVTIDSLRADHCGHHGYNRETTPTLDQMASEGLVFENAIAPGPRTPDSLPAIFTGYRPIPDDQRIESEREVISNHLNRHTTLAEHFSKKGYDTAGFTPNPYTSRYFNFDTGFHHYQDFMDEDRSRRLFERILEGGSLPSVALRLLLSGIQRENVFKPWEAYYNEILEWIESASEPYFLWVFLMDCHIPYLANSETRTQSRLNSYYANLRWYWEDKDERFPDQDHDRLVTAYDDSIRYSDAFLNQLSSDISDASFVVTADHGESFFEHGRYGHPPECLYEENINVPLVVYDGSTEGSVSKPVSISDLGNLLNSISEGTPKMSSPNTIVSHPLGGDKVAVRGDKWKYISKSVSNGSDTAEVYNLLDNPDETNNIAETESQLSEIGQSICARRSSQEREREMIRQVVMDNNLQV
ncbi:sulfatase-like hydrolase/transferase [Halorubrum sp. AS12]|uniref:sulfatase n=1 Tax=Halorubrum sp. AS12 TaxID=3409687 RepID=UPI003DA711BC